MISGVLAEQSLLIYEIWYTFNEYRMECIFLFRVESGRKN